MSPVYLQLFPQNIAVDAIFENYPNVKFTGKELQKLFKTETSKTPFIFNNETYDRIDGVTVGTILANLLIGHHEKDQIEEAQVVKHSIKDMLTIFLQCLSLN